MDFFARQLKRKAGHVTDIPRTMSSLLRKRAKDEKMKSFRKKRKTIVRFKANLPSISRQLGNFVLNSAESRGKFTNLAFGFLNRLG